MTMSRWLPVAVALALGLAAAGQLQVESPQQALGMSYTRETPPNRVRLALRRLQGQAKDRMENVIPGVQLGVYTDAGPHRLLAASVTDEHGKFDFGKAVPPGDYRLIAKYPGLCTANIPVEINPRARHSHLELRMEYPGLDVCSYAQAK